MFVEISSSLLTVLTITLIFVISELRKYYQEKKLRELVSWSVIGDYCPTLGRYSYNSELLFVIVNAQYEYGIKKKYCIAEKTEEEYMREIIEEFQREMARSYFKGEHKTVKSKYVIWGKHYFMYSLQSFLSKHQCDDKFLGYDMREERISCEEYSCDGYKSTYTLTDFAVVYHKMYYISHVFCKNCKPLIESNLALPFDNEKNIAKILNTKQIELSTY